MNFAGYGGCHRIKRICNRVIRRTE